MQHLNSPLWDKCLEIIRDTIPEEHYHYWFSPLSFESLKDNVLTISCPSEFFVEQLEDRYVRVLKSALDRVFG